MNTKEKIIEALEDTPKGCGERIDNTPLRLVCGVDELCLKCSEK